MADLSLNILADLLLNQVLIGQQLRPPSLEPSLDWMTQKISGKIRMATMGVDVDHPVSHPCFLCLPFSTLTQGPHYSHGVWMVDEHLVGSVQFPGLVLHKDPVWAAGSDCASCSMVLPCVSHPPLSSHQTEGCIMAIVLSHLDDASLPSDFDCDLP